MKVIEWVELNSGEIFFRGGLRIQLRIFRPGLFSFMRFNRVVTR
nr:MAG TPA: hypothetical protein [Caudoviricetes sp.]